MHISKGKKNRKKGRNLQDCQAYKVSHQREKNKIARLERVLAKNPNDKNAIEAIARCRAIVKA